MGFVQEEAIMIYSEMRLLTIFVSSAILLASLMSGHALGFGSVAGSCEGDCTKCHQISLEEATDMVKEINPEIDVLDVRLGPVGGLWEVIIKARGKRGIAYIDFAKEHVVTGSVISVAKKENITNKRLYEISKIDISAIELDEALVMGDPLARYRVVVFDDPD